MAAVFFVPLSHLSVMFAVLPSTRFPGWRWLLTALALPIVTWAAWPFHRVALRNARHRTASMETLISVGVTAATLWSLFTIFAAHPQRQTTGLWQALMSSDAIYLEVAAGVTVFVLAGRYFEARAKSKAGSALRALAAMSAKTVAVLHADGSDGHSRRRTQGAAALRGSARRDDRRRRFGGRRRRRRRHERDDRRVQTRPRASGFRRRRGTVVLDGRLVVEAAAVGADTHFAAMVRLVEEAQVQKADAQRLADRISGIFVPAVFAIAAATAAGWLLAGAGADKAFSAALAVLVIACPALWVWPHRRR